MFVTTRYFEKYVLLVSFFIVFPNPVHESEATGEKAEFYFSESHEIFRKACMLGTKITN